MNFKWGQILNGGRDKGARIFHGDALLFKHTLKLKAREKC
jgi:hypothetical protein